MTAQSLRIPVAKLCRTSLLCGDRAASLTQGLVLYHFPSVAITQSEHGPLFDDQQFPTFATPGVKETKSFQHYYSLAPGVANVGNEPISGKENDLLPYGVFWIVLIKLDTLVEASNCTPSFTIGFTLPF